MSEMHNPNTHKWARKILIDLSVMTIVGVVLALIGPFGSISAPLPVRLVSWLGLAYVGYACYSPMGWVVERLEQSLNLPSAGLWVGAVLVATVPLATIIWSIGFLPGPVPIPTLEQGFYAYCNVLVIGASITVLFHLLERRQQDVGQSSPPASASSQPQKHASPVALAPRFLDRLPPALGSDLIALEMEDHYVRAHTALGSELVLLRMRDAVAELDGLNGAQVHRSWWVARGALCDVKRNGRNIRLILDGGLEAPVSRANVAPLRDAGWF